jgi:aspartate oxidase
MILAVTELFHDHEATQYFIDTEKLDPKNCVDAAILKECKKKAKQLNVFVDATNWEDNPAFLGEPGVSAKACKKKADQIDKTLNLEIYFDC